MDRFAYMLAHVVDYIVGASGWGGCGRAHMRRQFQGRDAARCYAPASIVEILRADAPAAGAPLDFGKMRRSGEAPTPQQRAPRAAAPKRHSSGLLIATTLRRPGPRQQLVELLHGPTVDELCEDVGQIGLWVELMEFCCLNQRRDAGPAKCSLVMTGKEAILSCHRDQTICALDTIGVHLDAAIFQEAYQAWPTLEPVTDCLANGTLLRYGSELGFQPGLQAFDPRPGFRLPRGATLLGALATDAAFDGIEFRDALECLARDRRRAPSVDVEEQSPPMRPAKNQRDLAVGKLPSGQLLIGGVAVALHDAGIAPKQSECMFTAAPGRVGVDDAWRVRSSPWPFVPGDCPEVSRLGSTPPGIEHWHLGLVHHDHGRGEQQLFHALIDRGEFGRGGA